MFKRRIAVIGTAALLGLAGMAGSALADDGGVRVHEGPGTHRVGEVRHVGKLVCWTNEGRQVRFSRAKVAEFVEEDVIKSPLAEVVDGETVIATDRFSVSVPAAEVPRKVVKHRFRGRVVHLTCMVDGPVDVLR
ncbi:MAG: hypothetical protein HOV96_40515 [Nonomuraea sp.]|nr:hypothetical protein [Nonomuraea sp.]NUP62890.1 hypothetical protein [Nonomuraea sp.]NUP83829.1 hypothetical protein [Nonomuraea sp.]NUS04893.1 hypothetical protein [Nonomuraea sp.]